MVKGGKRKSSFCSLPTGTYRGTSSPLCRRDSSRTSWLSECCKEILIISGLAVRARELRGSGTTFLGC